VDAEFDDQVEVEEPIPPPPMPRWLVIGRWIFALLLIVGALLLPVFFLGIRLHVHPWTHWAGEAVPEVAGLDVRIDPEVKAAGGTALEVGGTSIVNTPHPQTIVATVTDLEAGGLRLRLAHPEYPDHNWQVVFDLEQASATLTHAAASAWQGEKEFGTLEGTLLVNTLDWTSPGEKRGIFALHSTGEASLCFQGSVVIER